jgi:hypothetical protein
MNRSPEHNRRSRRGGRSLKSRIPMGRGLRRPPIAGHPRRGLASTHTRRRVVLNRQSLVDVVGRRSSVGSSKEQRHEERRAKGGGAVLLAHERMSPRPCCADVCDLCKGALMWRCDAQKPARKACGKPVPGVPLLIGPDNKYPHTSACATPGPIVDEAGRLGDTTEDIRSGGRAWTTIRNRSLRHVQPFSPRHRRGISRSVTQGCGLGVTSHADGPAWAKRAAQGSF